MRNELMELEIRTYLELLESFIPILDLSINDQLKNLNEHII